MSNSIDEIPFYGLYCSGNYYKPTFTYFTVGSSAATCHKENFK